MIKIIKRYINAIAISIIITLSLTIVYKTYVIKTIKSSLSKEVALHNKCKSNLKNLILRNEYIERINSVENNKTEINFNNDSSIYF